MLAPQLRIEVRPFGKQVLFDTVRQASNGSDAARPNDQVTYLAAYLAHEAVAARTIVVESPYVDRHYIEEYSRYYATVRSAPNVGTTRLHFFSEKLSARVLDELLVKLATGQDAYAEVTSQLQSSYLGFSVVRPIPSAPIGRTVLRTFGDRGSRQMLSVHIHQVHLCGMELQVRGVPFQQQELAVGACATTAVWSALAAASRATGRRPPTPFDVTDAATRHVLNDRPFPADSGLDLQQVLAAIRAHGFAPYTLKPQSNAELFSVAVKAYLSSGSPVVLLVNEPSGYHAITAVGYREPDSEYAAEPFRVIENGHTLRTTGMSRLYVHEDRLGPYARMDWTIENDDGEKGIWLRHKPFDDSAYNYGEEAMRVYAAIVPLYPKLRLSAIGLFKATSELFPVLRKWLGEDIEHVTFDLRFQFSGEYLKELLQMSLDKPERVTAAARQTVLPRYVARARFFFKDGAFLDAIFDTTDILRVEPLYSRLIAMVALVPSYSEQVGAFVKSQAPHALAF
jgi:hypothetical protein